MVEKKLLLWYNSVNAYMVKSRDGRTASPIAVYSISRKKGRDRQDEKKSFVSVHPCAGAGVDFDAGLRWGRRTGTAGREPL